MSDLTMVPVIEQIRAGRLVCPRTRQRLLREGDRLVTLDRRGHYPIIDDVPVLLSNPEKRDEYLRQQGEAMRHEYSVRGRRPVVEAIDRLCRRVGDGRSPAAVAAFEAVVAGQPPDALCVSIGGGPTRAHANLVNVNIDRFANVDVVADAYELPYADGAVDAIHCEAVLEHLEFPDRAVAEMFRVLRPGGQAFAATPFLQAFHAYPNHFQNFTLEGHDRLFRRAGFEVTDSGACVGPTFALGDLISVYLRSYVPTRLLSRALARFVRLALLALQPVDRRLLRSADAHVLASTVFARLRRP